MKTPFTPYFKQANLPLVQVSRQPFTPSHPMPFVADEATEFYVGDGCQVCYRWYDAFDVFVAVLEAYLPDARGIALEIPVVSHFCDLHIVYQLSGNSELHPTSAAPKLQLPANHHLVVYTPRAAATWHIRPDQKSHRFSLAALVPKAGWVTRHPGTKQNALDGLLTCLRQRHTKYHYLSPSPISSQIYAWIHLLLTTASHPGLLMDDAINHTVAHLVERHRIECALITETKREEELVEAARMLISELVGRMMVGDPPTIGTIAAGMETTPRRLRNLHYSIYKQKILHYIISCRITEAKHRLKSGVSISAVVYQLGWADPPSFSKQFKKHTGLSPREFIKS